MVLTQNNIKNTKSKADKLLKKVSLNVVKKIENQLQGDYRSIFRGSGLEFHDLREYTTYDDVRNIDWKVTARTNQPHVRTYVEEKELIVWLVIDLSESMDFASELTTKKDIALQFAATIAFLGVKQGNRIGTVLFDNDIKSIIPPSKGIKHVNRIISNILNYENAKNLNENDFSQYSSFNKLHNIIGKKNYIFFLSDFVFNDYSWEKEFAKMSMKNNVVAVEVWDKVEEKLPDIGYINMQDSETGKINLIDCSNKEIIEEYNKLIEEENAKKGTIFSKTKTENIKLYTDSDIASVLIEFSKKNSFKGRKR